MAYDLDLSDYLFPGVGVGRKPSPGGAVLDRNHPLSRGLVGLWLLNDGRAVNVIDWSGNGNTGTPQSAPSNKIGLFGQTLNFNGSSQWINVGLAPNLQIVGPLTLSAWINTNTIAAGQRAIISCAYSWGMQIGPTSGRLVFNTVSQQLADTGTILTTGVWYHVAVVCTGSTGSWTLQFYVNGLFSSSTTTSNNPTSGPWNVQIGNDYGNLWNGMLDVLRVYNRALSASEINTLYTTPFAGLVAPIYIPFITASGTITFNLGIAESGPGSDTQSSGGNFGAFQNESGTGSDSVTSYLSAALAQSEAGSVADSQAASMSASLSMGESGSATASANNTTTFAISISDSGISSDGQASSLSAALAQSEAGSVTDSASTGTIYSIVISESGTGSDSQTITMNASVSLSESGTGSDTQSSGGNFGMSQSESGTASDTQAANSSSAISLAETGTAADSTSRSVLFVAATPESGTAFDAIAGGVGYSVIMSDSGSMTEAQSAGLAATLAMIESGIAIGQSSNSATIQVSAVEYGNAQDHLVVVQFGALSPDLHRFYVSALGRHFYVN